MVHPLPIDKIEALGVGDAILATFADTGKTLALHVVRIGTAGSGGRSFSDGPDITIGYGLGRWCRTIDRSDIRNGRVVIERG